MAKRFIPLGPGDNGQTDKWTNKTDWQMYGQTDKSGRERMISTERGNQKYKKENYNYRLRES